MSLNFKYRQIQVVFNPWRSDSLAWRETSSSVGNPHPPSPSPHLPVPHPASINYATSVERGTAREKCLAQEYNTMHPVRAQTQPLLDLKLHLLSLAIKPMHLPALKRI